MLWTIAVVLIIFWMLGLVTGFEMDFIIHGLYAVAIVLLLISINREVNIYRGLKHMVRSRSYRRAHSRNVGSRMSEPG
jgi:hypothetical protein